MIILMIVNYSTTTSPPSTSPSTHQTHYTHLKHSTHTTHTHNPSPPYPLHHTCICSVWNSVSRYSLLSANSTRPPTIRYDGTPPTIDPLAPVPVLVSKIRKQKRIKKWGVWGIVISTSFKKLKNKRKCKWRLKTVKNQIRNDQRK